MSELDTLARLFEDFPGIGPRQAKRFVYFLLRADTRYRDALIHEIKQLSNGVSRCALCQRFIPKTGSSCSICSDQGRDKNTLMIVLKDADVESFEIAGLYKGQYLVLGSLTPLTESETTPKILSAVLQRLKGSGIEECILALPVTTDGEHTRELLTDDLKNNTSLQSLKITTLGRGLSTGSELEYADKETLQSAFLTRR